ncbi:MAG TPA: hypothetical protein VMF66_10230 [Candidatus Acidoferrum sp.]|nr:hypothetical protein [Candidatus Acidoferrum sp.]
MASAFGERKRASNNNLGGVQTAHVEFSDIHGLELSVGNGEASYGETTDGQRSDGKRTNGSCSGGCSDERGCTETQGFWWFGVAHERCLLGLMVAC